MDNHAVRVAVQVLLTAAVTTAAVPGQVGPPTVSITLKVSDVGRPDVPIPGVNVNVVDERRRQIASGPTDGNGRFVATLRAGQKVTIEYRLLGYVKDPERVMVTVDANDKTVDGWLVSKTDASEGYLRGVARTADELAKRAPTDEAKKASYAAVWDVVAELPPDSQRIVAGQISDKQYLAGVPSFDVAMKAPSREQREQRFASAGNPTGGVDGLKRIVYEVVLSEDQGNFKFATATLPDEAKEKLDQIMAQVRSDPKNVYFEIEGHTDNIGDRRTNERLGLERADAVRRYLYEQYQVPLFKIGVLSYGDEKPIASNNTRAGRAQNRRVVVKIIE